jgi:hypothetical protein
MMWGNIRFWHKADMAVVLNDGGKRTSVPETN